jgi:Condensation domain
LTAINELSPAKRALLERALQARRRDAETAAIPRRSGEGPTPLSFAQRRMWFLSQWAPGEPTFNGARGIRIRGALDRQALHRALNELVSRHESLRTVVVPGPDPVQRVLEDWQLELPVVALDATPAARDAELEGLLRSLAREPFELTRDLMLRATLIEVSGEDHVLLIRMHHIAADAQCDGIMFAELGELYAAFHEQRAPNLALLPIQYGDFAAWEREWLAGDVLAGHLAYWTNQLEGTPELLRLPTDRPRPPVQHHDGAHHALRFDAPLGARLLALGREEGATFFMTMLAAFATFLYRLTGEVDVVVGSPIANRVRPELDGLLGFFTNTVALRTRLGGNPSFREVVRRARETAVGAYEHQALPFDMVVEALRPRRDPSHNPVFCVNFRAQAAPRAQLELAGLETEPLTIDMGFSRFDLALEVQLVEGAITGYFEYNGELFEAETMVGFVDDLRSLLAAVVDDPDASVLAIALAGSRRARPAAPPRRGAARRRSAHDASPGSGR